MGFFDFLKKLIHEEEQKPAASLETAKKELSLEEIESRLNEKIKENQENSEKLKFKINEIVRELLPQLKEGLTALKSVNLKERKEDERLKSLVLEGLNIYSSCLEKLIADLETFEKSEKKTAANDSAAKLKIILDSFSKNSNKSYQKANVLVGKEFEGINGAMKDFIRKFNPILEEKYKNDIETGNLSKISEKFEELSEIRKAEKQIKSLVLKLDSEKEQKQADLAKQSKEKQKIVESQGYKLDMEKKQQTKEAINKLEKEESAIFRNIDFKKLAEVYHSNEKKHRIIQNYRENFRKAIEDDKEDNFGKIVKESLGLSINLPEIEEKIKELNRHIVPSEAKIKKIEQEISRLEKEIAEIEASKKDEEKKAERLKIKEEELIKTIMVEAKL